MSQQELQTAGHRLHNSSPLFLFIEAIKKMVFPLLLGIIGTSGDKQDWIIIGVAALASVMTIVQFWFYHYWLEEDRLVVKEGILFKSLRQVPYERIQNLNVEKNVLHRLFGVATLQVESASGAKPEAVIRVISQDQVAHIQNIIKQRAKPALVESDVVEVASEAVEHPALYQMSHKDVATYGFISHKALVPIGIVGSVLSQNDYYRDRFVGMISGFAGDLHVEQWAVSEWLVYSSAFALLMLVTIWLSSIAMAFLKLHGFTLSHPDNNLHADMGLLTRLTANIPVRRIQLIKLKHSPLHRLFKKVSIKMETAGGVTEQSGITMSWLAPLVSEPDGFELIKQIQPEVDLLRTDWQPLESRAWKRVFKKGLFFILLIMAPLIYFFEGWGLLMLLLIPPAYAYAQAYIRHAAYAVTDELIACRQGVFFRRLSVVRIGKIQNVSYLQTPFDRRNGMARLTVDTAGSNPVTQDINVHYLNQDKVSHLVQQLTEQVSQVKFIW
ncbi:PH domain-containing protein [Marinicella sediminis]|uniref:PH domain-containing protein n=1 Tax=Marinicella sediminis TaxID=1792834 RepID=A0ABV7JFD6_9GAMM|nr:PH domain-containing protein [Marinicella sediminis]